MFVLQLIQDAGNTPVCRDARMMTEPLLIYTSSILRTQMDGFRYIRESKYHVTNISLGIYCILKYLFVCLFVCLFVRSFVCLFVCLFVCARVLVKDSIRW